MIRRIIVLYYIQFARLDLDYFEVCYNHTILKKPNLDRDIFPNSSYFTAI